MDPFHTIAEVIQHMDTNYSNSKAFNHLENGHWKSISTESFIFDLKRLTYGLISLGLKRGDNVGILADSNAYWNLADLAIMMAGGVTIPLFGKIAHESFIYECALANIRFLFVQGKEHWDTYQEHRNLFETVISLDDSEKTDGSIGFHEILKKGEQLWEEKPKLWEELAHRMNTDDVCTIIYTAGSTGMPKGVQLTHKNLCHLISFEVFEWIPEDTYLSILPLPHVFARQINLILMAWGINIYYLNDLSRFSEVSRTLNPSLMIVVPRILERMYGAIEEKIKSQKNGFKGWLANWAFNLANDQKESVLKKYILRPIADFFVYTQLRDMLGHRWRVIISGGAALDPKLCTFYHHIGVPVYEGWGLTETSTATVNTPREYKIGTVGKPLPGVKVILGENDELLVGGPTVMKGYYRYPDATSIAIDEEGWLHTGDKGIIGPDGFVKIIGRVKEQFKLSSGEYLSPSKIEHLLCQHPLIEMALVLGEKRKYASCLLFPNEQVMNRLKKEQKLETLSNEEFLNSSYVKNEMELLLNKVNTKINSWEKIIKYRFILEKPSMEKGELTPTLKLKRDVILEKYQQLIDQMYREESDERKNSNH